MANWLFLPHDLTHRVYLRDFVLFKVTVVPTLAVACFTKEVNLRLTKRPLVFNYAFVGFFISVKSREHEASQTRLFFRLIAQTYKKENIKPLYYWPFVSGIHRYLVDSRHKGQVIRKVPGAFASSCNRHFPLVSGSSIHATGGRRQGATAKDRRKFIRQQNRLAKHSWRFHQQGRTRVRRSNSYPGVGC